ncbi:MAG: hypothetical protein ACI4SG_03010 [Oligosphaeraceae bacterium]
MPPLLLANSLSDDLAFQPEGIQWSADWWKLLILAFALLLLVFLTLKLALYILRLVGVALCLAFAAAGAWFSWQMLAEPARSILPESLHPYAAPLAAFAGFLLCFGMAAGVMSLLRKPAQPPPENKK